MSRTAREAVYNEFVQWLPQPRWKQYAAQSGWIYQYIFEGMPVEGEYHFRATSGPSNDVRIEVSLDAAHIARWDAAHRPLTGAECFGIAKMALLRALDEAASPGATAKVRPSFADISGICAELDL